MSRALFIRLLQTGALALALSACGRAGPLEPPPASVRSAERVADGDQPVEDRPFILDRLLK